MQIHLQTSLTAQCWWRAVRFPPTSSSVKAPGRGLHPSGPARPREEEQAGLFPAFRGRWERSSCFWSMEQVCSETLGGVVVLVSCSGVHIQGNLFFSPKPPHFTGTGQSESVSRRKQTVGWSCFWFLKALLKIFTVDTLYVPHWSGHLL